jgi:hypothetical protein
MAGQSGLVLERQLDAEKEQTMALQLGHPLEHGWEPKMGPSMEAMLE